MMLHYLGFSTKSVNICGWNAFSW